MQNEHYYPYIHIFVNILRLAIIINNRIITLNTTKIIITNMPIREGGAKLWFKTKEEQDEYDDRNIASIELKSTDFDNENFSPVFSRPQKEFVLKPTEKFHRDMALLSKPYFGRSLDELLDKYAGGKRNNSFYREWTIEKFTLGWVFGYLALREIPIRNFYARSFLMFVYISKVMDVANHILPGARARFYCVQDQYSFKDIQNYEAFDHNHISFLPNSTNRIHEALLWKRRQPGFMKETPEMWIGTFFPWVFGASKPSIVGWDGTFNMPLERLADPMHKDCMMVNFVV